MTTEELLITAALSVVPAVAATLLAVRLAAYAERGIWALRVFGIISLSATATPLWGKVIISPFTIGGWDAFPYAVLEQLPAVLLLCAAGLPGLLWRGRRARGYFLSLMIVGGLLTALATLGSVATEGWKTAVMPVSAFAFLVVSFAVFSRALDKRSVG